VVTVSELIAKLKDCAPGAEVYYEDALGPELPIAYVDSTGEKVLLG
jgi:hypothetical protein